MAHVIVVDDEWASWSLEHPEDCTDPQCPTATLVSSPAARGGNRGPNVPGPGRWRLLQWDRNAVGQIRLYVEPDT